jgi:diguanylate cyclase (GGDEF)-like protein
LDPKERESVQLAAAQTRPGSILVVDDDDALRTLVVRWLTSAGLVCVESSSGEDALAKAAALAASLDAIVCDVMMSGLDGFEVLARLKADPETAAIPVVLLTAHANADTDVVRGVEGGAVDHLPKPFSGPVLVAKVRAVARRGRSERALRTRLTSAEKHATIDALTHLFNRRHFDARLAAETSHTKRHARPLSVFLLDLDHFKRINDTRGHEVGDRVLAHVAAAVSAIARASDTAFRYGGEELVILLRDCTAVGACALGERLRAHLTAHPLVISGEEIAITFSAGVSSAHEGNAFDAANLVARADAALYRAKAEGRDRTVVE